MKSKNKTAIWEAWVMLSLFGIFIFTLTGIMVDEEACPNWLIGDLLSILSFLLALYFGLIFKSKNK